MEEKKIQAAIDAILKGRKYRDLDIPRETARDLLEKESKPGARFLKPLKA